MEKISFDDESKALLEELISLLKTQNDGGSNEFAREVCANIYADILYNKYFNNNNEN